MNGWWDFITGERGTAFRQKGGRILQIGAGNAEKSACAAFSKWA